MAREVGIAFDSDFFRSQGWWRDETLPDWLDRNVIARGDNAALATVVGTIAYCELSDRAGKLATALGRIGIGRDRCRSSAQYS